MACFCCFLRNSLITIRAFFIPILLDIRTIFEKETKRSFLKKRARLGVEVVTWLGIDDVNLLNSDSVNLGMDLAQGKI